MTVTLRTVKGSPLTWAEEDANFEHCDHQGKHTIWVPSVAIYGRTTSGAASGTAETSTNKVMLKTLDFDSASTEYAQFAIRMPKSWNLGTVTAAFTWSHPATTTDFGVSWAIQAVALSNDDGLDTAFGSLVQVVDTGGTTDDIYMSAESGAITIGGTPAAQDYVVFQVSRDHDETGDTMAVDARLHGVSLYYTINAATDD